MGFLDKVKGMFSKNADRIEDGLDKAGDFAKDKLPDQHDEKVDSAVDKAKDMVDKMDGDDDEGAAGV